MTLNDWITEKGLTQGQAADFLGCDQSTISRILNGRGCTDALKVRIHEKTQGAVTPNDLLGVAA